MTAGPVQPAELEAASGQVLAHLRRGADRSLRPEAGDLADERLGTLPAQLHDDPPVGRDLRLVLEPTVGVSPHRNLNTSDRPSGIAIVRGRELIAGPDQGRRVHGRFRAKTSSTMVTSATIPAVPTQNPAGVSFSAPPDVVAVVNDTCRGEQGRYPAEATLGP